MLMNKSRSDQDEKLLVLFKKAIESEQQAQNMYQEALTCCNDPLIREVLSRLLNDELGHESRLLEIYNVNAVARPKNIWFHFGIPTPGLVSKMDAGLQKLLHVN